MISNHMTEARTACGAEECEGDARRSAHATASDGAVRGGSLRKSRLQAGCLDEWWVGRVTPQLGKSLSRHPCLCAKNRRRPSARSP